VRSVKFCVAACFGQYFLRMAHHVYFTAIARVSDGLIVASYFNSPEVAGPKDTLLSTIKKMTTNPEFRKKAQPDKRFSLESSNFNVNFQADDSYAYFVLTHSSYPERVVFKLVAEIKADVFATHRSAADREDNEEGLSAPMRVAMSKLCQRYDDPANVDKLLAARQNVAKTTQTLTDTIDNMTMLGEATELAVQQTTAMARDTEKFGEEAEEFNQQLACYRRKLTWIIVGVSVAAVVVIIIIIVVVVATNAPKTETTTSSPQRRMLRGWSA